MTLAASIGAWPRDNEPQRESFQTQRREMPCADCKAWLWMIALPRSLGISPLQYSFVRIVSLMNQAQMADRPMA
jgi:hypothetical protein